MREEERYPRTHPRRGDRFGALAVPGEERGRGAENGGSVNQAFAVPVLEFLVQHHHVAGGLLELPDNAREDHRTNLVAPL